MKGGPDKEHHLSGRLQLVLHAFYRDNPPARDIMKMPEFEELYAVVESLGLQEKFGASKTDKAGKELPPSGDDLWFYYIVPLLRRIHPGPNWIEQFESLYPAWEEAIFADSATYEVFSPLLGVDCEVGSVELTNRVRIRPMTAEDRSYFETIPDRGHTPPSDLTELGTHVLSHTFEWPKAGGVPGVIGHTQFEEVIAAIRLVAAGGTYHGLEVVRLLGPQFGTLAEVGRMGASWGSNRMRVWGRTIKLRQAEVRRLDSLLDCLPTAKENRKISQALERYRYSIERNSSEDSLIDAWVGLEGLFLKSSERAELSYRASLRAANFIGDDPWSKVWIFTLSRKSYKIRSDIVHGEPTPKETYPLVTFTSELLRLTLNSCVLAGKAPELDEIDEAIAKGMN